MSSHKSEIKPSAVLNIVTGLPAAVMIQAEIRNIPALQISAILDSHYVTPETLMAFEPVTRDLLGFQNYDYADI